MSLFDKVFKKNPLENVIDQDLNSIKICSSCGEAASVELDRCPHCGAQLPETTAMEYVKNWKESENHNDPK